MLDFVEEALDKVALAVEREIAVALDLAISLGWNYRRDFPLIECVNQRISVVSFVAEERTRIDIFAAEVGRKLGQGPALALASCCKDFPRHRQARGFWWLILHAICRSLARRFFSRASAVLMSAHNGGIDHHIFVIVIARQQLENTFENPTLRPSAETLMD